MSMGLIVFLIILFIITMVLTLFAFKQEETKMKKIKDEGNTVENELKRSYEYESTSVKNFIPIQIWIYGIATLLGIIAAVIYFI